ncbi:MAG TPA: asparagine synthetase B [Steroidobacteraceae bacterium]|nr:asparagine synthetase B [Steroidobacteraceae bacterium]
MSAIWGFMGPFERWEAQQVGMRLAHRGVHEDIWAPAPHLCFGSRGESNTAKDTAQVPVTFAGSLLDREALGSQLGLDATAVAQHSDAALVWKLYRAAGAQALAMLNGQFALALYDATTGSLLLAVDRWSVQPLYFARVRDRWVFASEYRALLGLPDLKTQLDSQSIDYLQRTKYLPAGRALLANVHPVAPGQMVRIAGASYEAHCYSPLELDLRLDEPEDRLAGELREALLAAATSVVAGCDRIGIALSAGLDSTVTLGAVRAVAPRIPIHTYIASFDPDDPDLALAAESARHFGTIHREIILAPDDLPRLLPDLVWAMEDPCAREEMLVYHVLAQEAAAEVPLVLYGHMSDVLFGGMPRHLLIKMAATLPFARAPLTEFYNYTQTGVMPESLAARMLMAAYYRGRCVRPPRVLGAVSAADEAFLHLAEEEPLNTALLEALQHPTEVAAMERLHARAGVRFASLFHDERVARCAFRIPDRLKIRGRQRKYILRRAASGFLPERFALRRKGMIRIKQDRRLWLIVNAMASELLGPDSVRTRGLFDPEDVARLLGEPARRRARQEQFYRVWTLLLTEIWCRTFVDGRGTRYRLLTNPYNWRGASADGLRGALATGGALAGAFPDGSVHDSYSRPQ